MSGAPGGGGYRPVALQDVGPIDARRGDLDQHFAGPGLRHRPLDQHQLVLAVGAITAFIEEGRLATARLIDLRSAMRSTIPAVDLDDLFPSKPDDPLVALAKQDLDPMSIEELKARIEALKVEIARVENHMKRAQDHRSAAEELFKKS